MQIDWADVLAVAATVATLFASIYAARAAGFAAKQAGLQARFLIQEQDNRAWLQALLPRLQRSGIVVHGSDTAVAPVGQDPCSSAQWLSVPLPTDAPVVAARTWLLRNATDSEPRACRASR